MVIETSALAAIMQDEPERRRLIEILANAERVYISAASLLEAHLFLSQRIGKRTLDSIATVQQFIAVFGAEVIPVDEEIALIAMSAADRYRKGIHPAALNFGNLLSYATAKKLKVPLLFKGNDFGLTDVRFVQ